MPGAVDASVCVSVLMIYRSPHTQCGMHLVASATAQHPGGRAWAAWVARLLVARASCRRQNAAAGVVGPEGAVDTHS